MMQSTRTRERLLERKNGNGLWYFERVKGWAGLEGVRDPASRLVVAVRMAVLVAFSMAAFSCSRVTTMISSCGVDDSKKTPCP